MDQSLVAVVIPFHKPEPSPWEAASLLRAASVLKNYPRIMVVPENMPTCNFSRLDPSLKFEYFPAEFFSSFSAHQTFCRSASLYEIFLNYKYILWYHLDSYVFRDELVFWCNLNWDYVGGPWTKFEHVTSSLKWYRHFSSFLYPLMRKQGTGGFSLRKVETFYRASLAQEWLKKLLPNVNEDVYWACLGSLLHFPFKVADFKSSLRFSFDTYPDNCYQLNDGHLPFGCHAWFRQGWEFWKKFIPPP